LLASTSAAQEPELAYVVAMLELNIDPSMAWANNITTLSIETGLTVAIDGDEGKAQPLFQHICQCLEATAISCYYQQSPNRDGNETVGLEWLRNCAGQFANWDLSLAEDLVEAFNLELHIEKPLYMYSLGSARKLLLVAAFASNVDLTLLHHPFAALDGASSLVLADLLSETSTHPTRAWVIADFERPQLLRAETETKTIRL
jgi:ABC-type multidrug transport system ATPase subunit